tara:strand:+ start:120 stop:566 length:447 start_codon:yes stop_codon:yes gene_type:complete
MSYKIKQLQKDKARELGVTIAPSKNPEKKIDVFIGDKKVASIGANKSMVKGKPMMDYATYKIQKPSIAERRRENYIKRHSKEPKRDEKGKFTKSFYSDEILWGKKNDDVNTEIKAFKKYRNEVLKKEQEKKKKKEKAKKKDEKKKAKK